MNVHNFHAIGRLITFISLFTVLQRFAMKPNPDFCKSPAKRGFYKNLVVRLFAICCNNCLLLFGFHLAFRYLFYPSTTSGMWEIKSDSAKPKNERGRFAPPLIF